MSSGDLRTASDQLGTVHHENGARRGIFAVTALTRPCSRHSVVRGDVGYMILRRCRVLRADLDRETSRILHDGMPDLHKRRIGFAMSLASTACKCHAGFISKCLRASLRRVPAWTGPTACESESESCRGLVGDTPGGPMAVGAVVPFCSRSHPTGRCRASLRPGGLGPV